MAKSPSFGQEAECKAMLVTGCSIEFLVGCVAIRGPIFAQKLQVREGDIASVQ